jgi:prevent-host-death family protein
MEIGSFEARDTLGALLDRVEQGEEIVITRDGKRIAKLVPAEPQDDRTEARAAARRIRARVEARSPLNPPITIDEILSFRDEGRR